VLQAMIAWEQGQPFPKEQRTGLHGPARACKSEAKTGTISCCHRVRYVATRWPILQALAVSASWKTALEFPHRSIYHFRRMGELQVPLTSMNASGRPPLDRHIYTYALEVIHL